MIHTGPELVIDIRDRDRVPDVAPTELETPSSGRNPRERRRVSDGGASGRQVHRDHSPAKGQDDGLELGVGPELAQDLLDVVAAGVDADP